MLLGAVLDWYMFWLLWALLCLLGLLPARLVVHNCLRPEGGVLGGNRKTPTGEETPKRRRFFFGRRVGSPLEHSQLPAD